MFALALVDWSEAEIEKVPAVVDDELQGMFYLLVVTYVLGGITFFPLLAVIAIVYTFWHSHPVTPDKPSSSIVQPPNNDDSLPSLKTWLTVRHTFEASPSSYISMVRTFLDSRTARPRRAEDKYYGVLKRAVLYLYEDETMSECAAAIDVRRCFVRIVPDTDGMLDGELFARRNAVLLCEDNSRPTSPDFDEKQDFAPGVHKDASNMHGRRAWYIFFRSVHDMEDWYFAFLNAPAPFPCDAQRAFINTLDALPDRIPTRWLNALLGRIFLGVKGTSVLQEWVVGRLMKKLSKVKTPSWLTGVVVRSFDAGNVPPIFSKPMLKELTSEGDASVGVDISYVAPQDGGIRITMSAIASITLPAPPSLSMLGFKNKDKDKEQPERPYQVSLVLAIIVRRVEGNMLIKIKRAPSNRLWYAFTTMPRMDIEVKPVVRDRQISLGMITSGIESKLREIIQESVVLPYMDDIPFFDTSSLSHRGGIFADAFPSPDVTLKTSQDTNPSVESPPDSQYRTATEAPIDNFNSGDRLGQGLVHQTVVVESEVGGEKINNGSMRKRRTWVVGKQGASEETRGSDSLSKTEAVADQSERGFLSRHSTEGAVVAEDNDSALNATAQDAPPLPLRGERSSVSDFSSLGDVSPALSPSSGSGTGLSKSAPSTSIHSPVSPSSPLTPMAPSSFLATLRSRGAGMAEKQPALKDAMRKWGGAWAAALRKVDRDRESHAAPDGEEVWAEFGKNANGGGGYAELRRKVEQRERAREGNNRGGDDANTISYPIDIPGLHVAHEPTNLLERRASTSSASASFRRTGSDSSVPSSPQGGAQFLSPSAPKTTIELHTSTRATSPTPLRSHSSTSSLISSSNVGTPLFSAVPLASASPTTPIRAQPPKAASMVIPGIHAKHKGELMSLGSDSPEKPQSTTASPDAGRTVRSNSVETEGGRSGEDSQTQTRSGSIPPPLPPRNLHTLAETTISPASEALKTVAKQDAAARQPPPGRLDSSPIEGPGISASSNPAARDVQEISPVPPPLPPRTRPSIPHPQDHTL